MAPSVVTVVVIGAWLVLSNQAWSFGQLWILLALALFAGALLVGGLYLGRIGIQLQRSVGEGGADTPDARSLLDRWILGSRVVLLLLLLIVWDMVFKPGL